MQAAQEQEQQPGGGARAARSETDGRAEFREMFVSLVDPANLLKTEVCREMSGRMEAAAIAAGYAEGAEMASLLGGIFEDAADIADRPVDDGALFYTHKARHHIMRALYDTAVSYREGGVDEPIGKLRYARGEIAALRRLADMRRGKMRAADPPGSGLSGLERQDMGRICRDVEREEVEWVRAQRRARGEDPVFPPKPKLLRASEVCLDGEIWSSVEILNWAKGNGPPEGYEVVKIGDG